MTTPVLDPTTTPASSPPSPSAPGSLRERARRFVEARLPLAPPADLVEAALPAARARALAEAVLLFHVGFVLDDLRALRVPGFAVGIALALATLAFGSTFHARRLARLNMGLPRPLAELRLTRALSFGRFLAVAALVLFLAWVAVTAGGVGAWLD